jgi:hypothetical protein
MHKKYEKSGDYDSLKGQQSHNKGFDGKWRGWNLNFQNQKNEEKNDYWSEKRHVKPGQWSQRKYE